MKRAERIAIGTGRAEIENRAIGKLQTEIRLPVNLRLAVFRECNAVHQVFIVIQLILDFLDDRVQMSLMRSGNQSLSAASREGIVQCIRRKYDRLANITAIEVNDVFVGAAEVLLLMVPIRPRRSVPVVEICLSPQDRVTECFGQPALLIRDTHQFIPLRMAIPRTDEISSVRIC